MVVRRITGLLALAAAVGLVAAGCGGVAEQTGAVPDSASLAPADALVYATLTTDETSDQWDKAEALLERIPGARDGLTGATSSLGQGVDWTHDVAPALGPEVMVVVTGEGKTIALTQPDDESKLDALIAKSDTPLVHAPVEGWTAVAEKQADLDAYRESLARGTLADDDRLHAGFAALPDEALARVWVDVAALAPQLIPRIPGKASPDLDVGLDWLSAGVAADDDGVKLAVGTRTPGANGTEYEPKLFADVPADAVAALSFGGTQKMVDELEKRIPLGDIADQVENLTGVSVGGVLDAFSGEGVVYVRPGDTAPEVTLVLAPPDADKVWTTVDRLAHSLAEQSHTPVRTETENGTEVHVVAAHGTTVRYARLDGGRIIVTTGARGIEGFAGGGEKLSSSDAFRRAAEEVDLGERTGGFLYVDLDGLLPLVESASGGAVPSDAGSALEQLDSLILQSSGGGETTSLRGFLRLND
jgi:hypothetical protein